jgi:hypothetical protein
MLVKPTYPKKRTFLKHFLAFPSSCESHKSDLSSNILATLDPSAAPRNNA